MIKIETINDKLNIYETLHNYFANYVFQYMEYYYNVTSLEDIDDWTLSKNWLVVNYYNKYINKYVEVCLDTAVFIEFIKSKE